MFAARALVPAAAAGAFYLHFKLHDFDSFPQPALQGLCEHCLCQTGGYLVERLEHHPPQPPTESREKCALSRTGEKELNDLAADVLVYRSGRCRSPIRSDSKWKRKVPSAHS